MHHVCNLLFSLGPSTKVSLACTNIFGVYFKSTFRFCDLRQTDSHSLLRGYSDFPRESHIFRQCYELYFFYLETIWLLNWNVWKWKRFVWTNKSEKKILFCCVKRNKKEYLIVYSVCKIGYWLHWIPKVQLRLREWEYRSKLRHESIMLSTEL